MVIWSLFLYWLLNEVVILFTLGICFTISKLLKIKYSFLLTCEIVTRGTMSGKGFIKTFVFKIFCGNFGVSPSKCPSPEKKNPFFTFVREAAKKFFY